jgi:hypothetical protein
MVRKPNKIKLDKKDYLRALLTDTAPSDVPIIFSNDGFYINTHRARYNGTTKLDQVIKCLHDNFIEPQDKSLKLSQSYPHKYKIRKNDTKLRTLSLLHPRAQINYVNFYREYSDVITYLCSRSPLSIRAPKKVGNCFYSYDIDINSKYKSITIDTLESELIRKHASSFFAYSGIDRMYKIYTSSQYISLEKQYPIMWFLDVANCFDSIYTHSVSWATKNKKHIKEVVKFRNQFCQNLDTIMQRSNNNETNGIPVGAEFSRIFSEIIFQSIDLNIIEILKSRHKYKHNFDYTILRYVDDYVVFAKNPKTINTVYRIISDCLGQYNLYISDAKLKKYNRPFCTEKSNTIIGLGKIIEEFNSSLFISKTLQKKKYIYTKKIFRRDRFIHTFIDKVKRLCLTSGNGYSDVSSYLISTFSRRITEITTTARNNTNEQTSPPVDTLILRQALSIILELMFFFYSVYATVSASNKLAKTIIITDDFLSSTYPQHRAFIRTEIMNNIAQLSLDIKGDDSRDGYISLERLNIVLATSKFGLNYLIDAEYFNELLENTETITYFNIVSLLYYFQDHSEYEHLVKQIESIVTDKLNNNFDILKDSEVAYLLLDLLTCPYTSLGFRKNLINKFYSTIAPPISKSTMEIERDIELLGKTYWFIKWNGLDLLNLLERKELQSIY